MITRLVVSAGAALLFASSQSGANCDLMGKGENGAQSKMEICDGQRLSNCAEELPKLRRRRGEEVLQIWTEVKVLSLQNRS